MNHEISNMQFVRGWEEQFAQLERKRQAIPEIHFSRDDKIRELELKFYAIHPHPLSRPQLWEISRISGIQRKEFENSMRSASSYSDFLPTTKISTTIYYSPFIVAVAFLAFGLGVVQK